MKLPLTITPCPIVETVFEVRFSTTTPGEAVLGMVYQVLRDQLPKVDVLVAASLPAKMTEFDPGLTYQPHHRLKGNEMTAMVGPRVVALAWTAAYPGWPVFAERVHAALERVQSTGLIETPERYGLRYINHFAGNILSELTLDLRLCDAPLEGRGTSLRTQILRAGCLCQLHVAKDMQLTGDPLRVGTIIDIDTSLAQEPEKSLPSPSEFLKIAHAAEKELFFSLLKPTFLKTLAPVYDSPA